MARHSGQCARRDTRHGERVDLLRLRAAADAVNARIFADVTQSLGVLDPDLAASRPDYLAVHGYKWLLCPRGAAWLVTRHHHELRPLMPSWKSAADEEYFGGPLRLADGAARCDASPAWLSWIGAEAAITLLSALPAAAVERHCLALAAAFRDGALEAGAKQTDTGLPSHIVAVQVTDPDSVAARLRASAVRARMLGDRLRVGFHYFNNDEDVAAALGVLRGFLCGGAAVDDKVVADGEPGLGGCEPEHRGGGFADASRPARWQGFLEPLITVGFGFAGTQ